MFKCMKHIDICFSAFKSYFCLFFLCRGVHTCILANIYCTLSGVWVDRQKKKKSKIEKDEGKQGKIVVKVLNLGLKYKKKRGGKIAEILVLQILKNKEIGWKEEPSHPCLCSFLWSYFMSFTSIWHKIENKLLDALYQAKWSSYL